MSRRLPSLRLPEGTELIPFIVLSIVIFAAINPAFVKPANLLTILSSLAFVGVIAVGQTVVIIGGQIDLSVGANAALSAVVSAKLMVAGVPIVLNTSFNENEPVVCKPEEAIDCFLRTKMDVLVLGDTFIER